MGKNKTAEKIKEAIVEKGFTQQKFAKKIGIGESMISKWLSGSRNPSLRLLEKIAKATGKPLSFFVENSGNTQVGDNNTVGNNNNADTIAIMKKYIEKLEEENKSLKIKLLKRGNK